MVPLIARDDQEMLLPRPAELARRLARARHQPLAHDARDRAAERARRHRHRHGARGRARRGRDRAAAAALDRSTRRTAVTTFNLVRRTAQRTSPTTSSTSAEAGGPSRPHARVGRRARADRVDPGRELRRASDARAQPQEDDQMSEESSRTRRGALSTMEEIQARPSDGASDAADRSARGRRARRDRRSRDSRARSCSTCATSTSTTARRSRSRASTCEIYKNLITAMIGPSGCGKSDVRAQPQPHERLDLRASASPARRSTTATTSTASGVDPVEVRRRIGMVFQRPNPFPKSIFDNVAWAPRILGMKEQPRRARREGAARRGAVGRGQGPPQARARSGSRAASSSACASRARSRSSPTCCCSTSPLGARPDLDGLDRGADARRSRATTRS